MEIGRANRNWIFGALFCWILFGANVIKDLIGGECHCQILFGENAQKCEKNEQINIQRLSNFVSKTIKILFGKEQKRENLRKSFAFASAKYGGVKKSGQEWARVGKSGEVCPKVGTWTLVPSLTLRASLQDDVR